MSSKLLLHRYFWDKLPDDYLQEIRLHFKLFPQEAEFLNKASVTDSISTFSNDFWFAVIDYFRVDDCKKSLQFSEEFANIPLSEIVKDLLKHIPKINDAYYDEKKWFDLVTKTNQSFFIFFMVDRRLEKDIFNQKLWKQLIHFLVINKEFTTLLGVYSMYCRIFPTDYGMLQSYKNLAKKHGKIYVSWNKPFDFEVPREKTPKKAINISYMSMIKYIHPKNRCHHQKMDEIFGRMAFPSPIIYYIRKKASPKILQKLHESAKYFFFLQPTPFCHRFILSDTFKESEFQFISMGTSATAKPTPKNLHILNTLHVCEQADKLALSKFLPNFYQLDIKFLRIHNQELTFAEFEFIVNGGNVEVMELNDIYIYEDEKTGKNGAVTDKTEKDGTESVTKNPAKKQVALEGIIKLCPKITEFFSSPSIISPNTAQFLHNFNFQNKIRTFYTYYMNNLVDIDSFSKFIKVRLSGGKMAMSFSPTLDHQVVTTFIEELKQKIKCSTVTNFTHLPLGNI